MPTINLIVGESIRRQREKQELSQGDLAERLGVDRSYISTLENGSRNPSLETLANVCETLGITLATLVEPLRYSEPDTAKVMPYVTGLIKDSSPAWEGKNWYHQRFDGSPYLLHMIAEAEILTRRLKKHGLFFDQHFCFFEDGKADWYIDVAEIERVSRNILQVAETEPHISKKLIEEYGPLEKRFYEYCDRIGKENLYQLSNEELIALHDGFVQCVLDRNSSSSMIDGFALGTDRLLEGKLKKIYEAVATIKNEYSFSEFFSILTTPSHTSFVREAELELFRLAQSVRSQEAHKATLIRNYLERFFWIRNNYVDAYTLTVPYFEEELARLESSELDIEAEIKRLEQMPEQNRRAKKNIMKHISFDAVTECLLEITEDFTEWQDERKKATMLTAHYATLLLTEISRRLNVSVDLLKYLSPREISNVFTSAPGAEFLEERRRQSVFYWNKNGHEAMSGIETALLRRTLLGEEEKMELEDFRGMTAALGKAEGRVKIIRSVKEIGRVEPGDILVTVMTRPDYVPAMKKAAAIVTDEGGITSHAAIVSRELKIPCVIGTKIATRALKDGDIVQVNANHGLVRIIKRA